MATLVEVKAFIDNLPPGDGSCTAGIEKACVMILELKKPNEREVTKLYLAEHQKLGIRVIQKMIKGAQVLVHKIKQFTPDLTRWLNAAWEQWKQIVVSPVKYRAELREFRQYDPEHGYYVELPEEVLDQIIREVVCETEYQDYDEEGNVIMRQVEDNAQNVSYFKRMLMGRPSVFTRLVEWDKVLTTENGIPNRATKTVDKYTPDILVTRHWPVMLIGFDAPYGTPNWNKVKETYPEQVAKFESMLQAMIFRDASDEVMLFLVGRTGSAKGTTTQLIDGILGMDPENPTAGLVTHAPFETLGDTFGLYPLIGKVCCLNREMYIGKVDAKPMTKMKDIVTHEGPVHINGKNLKQFEAFLDIWFVGASNQLFELPLGIDRLAWFRRCCILVLDKILPRDPAFKEAVLMEKDAIFTNLYCAERVPLLPKGTDIDAYARAQADLWDTWSNPALRVMAQLGFHVPEKKVGKDAAKDPQVAECANPFLYVDFVVELVGEQLSQEGIVFKDPQLKAAVTNAAKTLGALPYPKRTNAPDRRYIGLTVKDNEKENADMWQEYVTWCDERKKKVILQPKAVDAKQGTLDKNLVSTKTPTYG